MDVETAGLAPAKHPIIQVGAVAFDVGWNELERFEVKLKFDEADADPESLKKVRYDRRLWSQHAVESQTAHERFCYFLREHATLERFSRKKQKQYHVARLFAHNARFDAAFLWHWHKTLQAQAPALFLPADRRMICTMQTALIYFDQAPATCLPPANYKLETLCNYFSIAFSANEAHDALYDARATAQLYRAMFVDAELQRTSNVAA